VTGGGPWTGLSSPSESVVIVQGIQCQLPERQLRGQDSEVTPRLFRCSVCHARFRDRESTVEHARAEHNRDFTYCRVVMLYCGPCGLEFLAEEAWRTHKAAMHWWWTRAREREWTAEASWRSWPC